MKNNEKKINNISIIISAVIIAIVALLIEMLGSILLKNIELPKIITYLLRPAMYIVTIIFAQFLTQKISAKLRDKQ